MNPTKLLVVFTLIISTVATLQERSGKSGSDSEKHPGRKLSVEEVKEYRRMIRVNEKPVDMVESTKHLCAMPSSVYGPHYDPGVVYYINEVARRGLKLYAEKRRFPVGSIIVKEKQERRTEDSVQIITVMKKVSLGDGESSWDYKMYDATRWTEIDTSKQASSLGRTSCITCHRHYKNSDYISPEGSTLLLAK
jgi:hypothetical protein